MLFSSQSSNQFNSLNADALSSPALQSTSAALSLSTVSSGLTAPLHQSGLAIGSSASTDAATAGIIALDGSPNLSTNVTSTVITSTVLTSNALISDVINVNDPYRAFSTEGGSTLATATNLGSLTGTPQSITAFFGVSSSAPNDYYRVTLGANSNFNLSMTGLTADADVQFLNSVGTEIARSAAGSTHDEAINVSGLTAGDYYVHVYQYSGNTGFSLDLSSSRPSNLLPQEFELGTVGATATTRIGTVSDSNTADSYHFSVDGFYPSSGGGEFVIPSGFANSSNVNLSLTGLSADADVRIIRDANHNGLVDAGEEIVRSAGVTASESIDLRGLGVGDYFAQVYQYSGATNYTLSLSAQGGSGVAPEPNDTMGQAYDVHTLNGSRAFSGHVNGGYPRPMTFDYAHDPDDFYRFNVGATSNLNLSLTGLNGDADLDLFNSNGTIIASSHNGGTTSDSISRTLAAGDYYVQVHAYNSNSTNYNLNLNATPV